MTRFVDSSNVRERNEQADQGRQTTNTSSSIEYDNETLSRALFFKNRDDGWFYHCDIEKFSRVGPDSGHDISYNNTSPVFVNDYIKEQGFGVIINFIQKKIKYLWKI